MFIYFLTNESEQVVFRHWSWQLCLFVDISESGVKMQLEVGAFPARFFFGQSVSEQFRIR